MTREGKHKRRHVSTPTSTQSETRSEGKSKHRHVSAPGKRKRSSPQKMTGNGDIQTSGDVTRTRPRKRSRKKRTLISDGDDLQQDGDKKSHDGEEARSVAEVTGDADDKETASSVDDAEENITFNLEQDVRTKYKMPHAIRLKYCHSVMTSFKKAMIAGNPIDSDEDTESDDEGVSSDDDFVDTTYHDGVRLEDNTSVIRPCIKTESL